MLIYGDPPGARGPSRAARHRADPCVVTASTAARGGAASAPASGGLAVGRVTPRNVAARGRRRRCASAAERVRRSAACTRAWRRAAAAPEAYASRIWWRARAATPLHRGARRHRGPAQPRRDPPDVDAAGADGVVRQPRHAAPLDGAAAKASAGRSPRAGLPTVVNIARALEELKEAGVWTVGLAGDAQIGLRRGRFHACRQPGRRGRGRRAAAPGAGAVRLAGRRFPCGATCGA